MNIISRRRGRGQVVAIAMLAVVAGGVACTAVGSQLAAHTAPPVPGVETNVGPGSIPGPKAGQPGAPALQAASSGPGAPAPMPASAVSRSSAADSTAPAAASNTASTLPDTTASQSLDRMVIRTAQLAVQVGDVETALSQVRQIASRDGGFVSASNTHIERVNDQDRTIADLTLQVRSSSADATLTDLRALGKVTAESSGSQDVTDEYVDLDSNLRNLQASEAAVLKLMDRATQIQDVLSLQRELTNIRGQIERLQGRKTYLERRTDMATITLSLQLPPVQAASTLSGGAWDPLAVARQGWQSSLAVLRGVADTLIVAVAFSWWLVPLVGLGAYFWQRRRRPAPPTVLNGGQA